MTKEDKQIIERATKENWRIGDKTRLKHLLEKNLELYRENVELENKIADIKANCDLAIEGRDITIKELTVENVELKEKYDKVDIIGYDALKNLTKAENIIRELLFHLTNDTFYVTFETREQSVERARQFLQRRRKMKDEEMAEEYATTGYDKNLLTKEQVTVLKCGRYDGFLAGLKAGRPQWHDLRKDPTDLPKEVGNYLVCYIDTMLNRNVFILEFVDFLEDSHWIDETSHEIEKFDEGVIAWCEIPTFDKE